MFGLDQNSYYHENFIRGRPELISQIQRMATKGNIDRPTGNSLDPPNFYQDIYNSPFTQQSAANIPFASIPSGSTSSVTSSEHAILSEDQNETIRQLRLQIQAHNVLFENTHIEFPTPGFQNANTSLLNFEPTLLMNRQQTEHLRNNMQILQSPVPSNNPMRIQETMAPFQSLLSFAPSFEMQQQVSTFLPLADGGRVASNNMNSAVYGSNLGVENMIQLLLSTAPISGMQQQSTTALPISQQRTMMNAVMNQMYQPHSPAIYGTNISSENVMMQLLSNVQSPATTLPSRMTPSSVLNQQHSSDMDHQPHQLATRREDLHSSYSMNPYGTNPNLDSGNSNITEHNGERENDATVQHQK